MTTSRSTAAWAAPAALALLFTLAPVTTQPTRADFQVITNGGFELGLSGWTRQDQIGSEGSFFQQSGTGSPLTSTPVPTPPGGLFAAMTDAEGPGAHVLYQDFVVPVGMTTGLLSFSLYIGNSGPNFFTPNTLDFATPALNQQARVDILRAGTDPFSLAPGDLLLNAFRTQPSDPLVSGYRTYFVDVTPLILANIGQTLRLRFAETDNVSAFQFGVDNVSLAAIPEPSSLVLLAIGGAVALIGYSRRRPVGQVSP